MTLEHDLAEALLVKINNFYLEAAKEVELYKLRLAQAQEAKPAE